MNFIFIVGCPHSGTSIMHRLISEHPDVYSVPSESFLFREAPENRTTIISDWKDAATQAGSRNIAEKTPWHLFYLHELLPLVDKARVVCMIRDGRDVVTSLMKRGRTARIDGTLGGCADLWIRSCQQIESLSGSDYFQLQRLEDLCEDPRTILAETLDFLELPHDREVIQHILSYNERPKAVYADCFEKPESVTDGQGHSKLRNYQVNSPIFRSTSRFRDELSQDQISELEAIMQIYLKKHAYL